MKFIKLKFSAGTHQYQIKYQYEDIKSVDKFTSCNCSYKDLTTTLDKLHLVLLAMVSVIQTGTHVLHGCALISIASYG